MGPIPANALPPVEGTSNAGSPVGTPNLESLPATYLLNLVFIGLFGVLVCAWVLYYTDSFEVVGGLLALGGAFSWLAFLLKVLRDERLKSIQDWFDRSVFVRIWPILVVISLSVIAIAVFSCVATVQIEAISGGGAAIIDTPAAERTEAKGEWSAISQGSHVRKLFWVWPGEKKDVQVKYVGLPPRIFSLHGWQRLDLQAPDSFERPVILLRPKVTLFQSRANNPVLLLAKIGSKSFETEFRGQALWIGTDSEIEVPTPIIDRWRAETRDTTSCPFLSPFNRSAFS